MKIKSISTSEIIAWTERLSMLLRAGVSLSEALQLMSESSSRPRVADMNRRLFALVSRGGTLSIALEADSMPGILVHLVHIGEGSGALSETLGHAAAHFRSKEDMKQKVISAATYPILIGCATFSIAGFLVGFIFPKIMPLFISMKIVLPLPTRILLSVSRIVTHEWGWLLLAALVIGIGAPVMYRKSRTLRGRVEATMLRLPIVSSVMCEYISAHAFDIISMQLQHGCSLPQALIETARSIRTIRYEEGLIAAGESVSRGGAWSGVLRKLGLFSFDAIGLISIAERTGELASACSFIAQNARQSIERTIATMSRLIEPVLMIGMGLIVGSIALSIIMPIYEITNQINAH
jgi:type IV pilus assembly protein PilC